MFNDIDQVLNQVLVIFKNSKFKLPSVKQTVSENLPWDTGRSNPVLCDNLQGQDVVGDGREVQDRGGGHMYAHGWFMLVCGRNQNSTVKQLSSS